jgi:hypothetical protein
MNNENNLIRFEWKAIAIGLALILVGFLIIYLLKSVLGSNTALFGFIYLTASCAVAGYIAKGHIMNGAIHGGIVGALVIIIIGIYIYLLSGSYEVFSKLITLFEMLLLGVISLGIIGGSIGGLILMIINRTQAFPDNENELDKTKDQSTGSNESPEDKKNDGNDEDNKEDK